MSSVAPRASGLCVLSTYGRIRGSARRGIDDLDPCNDLSNRTEASIMSTLKLSLYKEHLGSEMDKGVVARVQRFRSGAGENETLQPTFQDVVIPAGRQTAASLDVEPGRYRIQVFLPSGQVLQEDRE